MHTAAPSGSTVPAAVPAAAARVAVAGATGYTGQELIRLLARHRGVTITAAMSSGSSSGPRKLPALAHLWDGEVEPFAREPLEHAADVVFLALPDAAAADLA